MKNTLKLLSLITVLILAGSTCAWAEKSNTNNDSWDQLLKDQPQTDDQSWEINPPRMDRPGRGRGRGQGMGNGPGMGEGRGRGMGKGPGRGMGKGPGMGRGTGMGQGPGMGGRGDGPGNRGGRHFGYINADELRDFLQKHEPELAEKMQQLRKEDTRQFARKVEMLKKLYGPAMRQMAVNTESGELCLKKIRIQLKVEQTMADIKKTTDPDDLKQAKRKLHTQVGQMFDIVVAQRKQHLSNWQERLEEWDKNPGRGRGRGDGKRGGRRGGRGMNRRDDDGKGMGRGSGRNGRGRGPLANPRENLKERQKDIETWEKNKKVIVNKRVRELLTDAKPFPWDRR